MKYMIMDENQEVIVSGETREEARAYLKKVAVFGMEYTEVKVLGEPLVMRKRETVALVVSKPEEAVPQDEPACQDKPAVPENPDDDLRKENPSED